jgi:multidrug resistance efflux pump
MHFEKGQALYIIEVMKMFNTVRATFSGTIDKIIMQGADGSIVQKGQPLFKVTPDEKFIETNPEEIKLKKREHTSAYLKTIL